MTFKFKPVSSIKKVISVQIPGDFDQTTTADFEAEFKRLSVSDARALIESIQAKTVDEEQTLFDNVLNLKGIADEDGNEIEFTKDLLKQLIEESYIRSALLSGFMDVNYNLSKLRQKN